MPVASNGFLFSKHAPHYHPTFDQHRRIALLAEKIGIDYLFWMGKWKGFGGELWFWEQSLEPMTLVSGIAAVTTPVSIAGDDQSIAVSPDRSRQDDHDHSRGQQWPLWYSNVVTGNTLDEVEQMGVVPEGYSEYRYGYADEWMEVLYRLWSEQQVSFDGRFFHLSNCVSDPKPRQDPPPAIVSAGTSDEGLNFAVRHSELIFIGTGRS